MMWGNFYRKLKQTPELVQGVMFQYNVGVPFKRITISTAEPFTMSRRGNEYLPIAMYYEWAAA
jgi:hypothetical protein